MRRHLYILREKGMLSHIAFAPYIVLGQFQEPQLTSALSAVPSANIQLG
jgi:hypothetical protein